MQLQLFNTRSNTIEPFVPHDSKHISMYVCGPTVYDIPHIGNARPSIVFDVLFRLLNGLYPRVTYVHNITDVDDKIIARASSLNIPPHQLAQNIEELYKQYLQDLNICLPSVMPRATDHIDQMCTIIQDLIQKGHAYVIDHNVLFHVPSCPNYGALANKNIDDLISNVRIDGLDGKRHAADFVLWKPAKPGEPSWPSPWGNGRPGWHIECSAMIHAHLSPKIDIHGGGIDLVFPHHENEIAQSVCHTNHDYLARYFLHNGHVLADNAKMSKTLGNTIQLDTLLEQHGGPTIRIAMLMAHYRQPLNWCDDLVQQAHNIWKKIKSLLPERPLSPSLTHCSPDFLSALLKDLNTPEALRVLLHTAKDTSALQAHCAFLGLPTENQPKPMSLSQPEVEELINQRSQAKKAKDFSKADAIREQLNAHGIIISDGANGTTWKYHG